MKKPALAFALLLPIAVTALVVTAAPAPAKEARVAILSIVRGYDPARVTVAAGETVTWVNEDADALHNAVCDASCPEPFSSGPSAGKGSVGSHRFTKIGAYRYHCELHPNMMGDVVVTEAPAPTTTIAAAPAGGTTTTLRAGATTSTSTPPESTTTSTTEAAAASQAPSEATDANDANDDGDDQSITETADETDDSSPTAPIVFAAILLATALGSYLATRAGSRS